MNGLPRFARNDVVKMFGVKLNPSLRGALATKQSIYMRARDLMDPVIRRSDKKGKGKES